MRPTILLALASSFAVLFGSRPGGASPFCSISLSAAPPAHPRYTYVWATAEADTLLTGPGARASNTRPGHLARARQAPVYGQRFTVHGMAGRAIERRDPAVPADEIVVVMWDYDGACQPTPWGLSAVAVRPGQDVFMLLVPRARTRWPGGLPTFDSFFAGMLVHPGEALATSGIAARRQPRSLTAREVFTLAQALPQLCDWTRDPTEATRRLARAKRRYSSLLSRWPGTTSLVVSERYARDARAGVTLPYLRNACAT